MVREATRTPAADVLAITKMRFSKIGVIAIPAS